MNKMTKWGIVGVVGAGLIALGINTFVPKQNEDLKAVPSAGKGQGGGALNVRAVVMGEQSLTDGLYVSGSLAPDEEVSLSFETSGKITEILFREGSYVEKGELLAKINDAPLQAELRRQQAQVKLMQDRVFRAKALLAKEELLENMRAAAARAKAEAEAKRAAEEAAKAAATEAEQNESAEACDGTAAKDADTSEGSEGDGTRGEALK